MGSTVGEREFRKDGAVSPKMAEGKTVGDYIHTSTVFPIVLAFTILLCAVGIVVWTTQIKFDMNIDTIAFAYGNTVIMPLDDNYLGIVHEGQNVISENEKGTIKSIKRSKSGMYYCTVEFNDLAEGIHDARIMTSQFRPIDMITSLR